MYCAGDLQVQQEQGLLLQGKADLLQAQDRRKLCLKQHQSSFLTRLTCLRSFPCMYAAVSLNVILCVMTQTVFAMLASVSA